MFHAKPYKEHKGGEHALRKQNQNNHGTINNWE